MAKINKIIIHFLKKDIKEYLNKHNLKFKEIRYTNNTMYVPFKTDAIAYFRAVIDFYKGVHHIHPIYFLVFKEYVYAGVFKRVKYTVKAYNELKDELIELTN